MLSTLRSKLGYANVMATLAVFVALGTGGAYAANTIGSADIIDGSVGSADVKDNSINTFDVHSFLGVDVADGSLTGSDFATGAVASAHIRDNTIESQDIVTGGVTGSDVSDGSLTGQEIGSEYRFDGTIGRVGPNACAEREVTGIPIAEGDHLVLTPDVATSEADLNYTALAAENRMLIKVCNPNGFYVEDGVTGFRLLVIKSHLSED